MCLTWLNHPDLAREVIEDLLLAGFYSVIQACACHDEQARKVLEHLTAADKRVGGPDDGECVVPLRKG